MHATSKILIVDDHPIFRKGLSQLLGEEKDLVVCGEAEDAFEAERLIAKLKPDLVIVDITLRDTSGLELLRHVRERYEDLPVLVLSMHDESIYAERVLRAGARGYIMKQEMSGSVVQAVRQVLAGKIFASQAVVERMLGRLASPAQGGGDDPVAALSDRELEVFRLVGRGCARRQIASKLNVSVKTVGTYRDKIREKLGIGNSAELVRRAIDWAKREDREP
ncbi:MAG: response regulator transcription factor [Spirochaetes bacterium]|nr:MAG: response regulator transcription factor [Spirochaetota bacterium]